MVHAINVDRGVRGSKGVKNIIPGLSHSHFNISVIKRFVEWDAICVIHTTTILLSFSSVYYFDGMFGYASLCFESRLACFI